MSLIISAQHGLAVYNEKTKVPNPPAGGQINQIASAKIQSVTSKTAVPLADRNVLTEEKSTCMKLFNIIKKFISSFFSDTKKEQIHQVVNSKLIIQNEKVNTNGLSVKNEKKIQDLISKKEENSSKWLQVGSDIFTIKIEKGIPEIHWTNPQITLLDETLNSIIKTIQDNRVTPMLVPPSNSR